MQPIFSDPVQQARFDRTMLITPLGHCYVLLPFSQALDGNPANAEPQFQSRYRAKQLLQDHCNSWGQPFDINQLYTQLIGHPLAHLKSKEDKLEELVARITQSDILVYKVDNLMPPPPMHIFEDVPMAGSMDSPKAKKASTTPVNQAGPGISTPTTQGGRTAGSEQATAAVTPPPAQTEEKERTHTIDVEYLYQDGTPIVRAPYTVTLADGSQVEGTLDDNGKLHLDGVPAGQYQVELGEDAREYQAEDKSKPNPLYGTITPEQAVAMVDSGETALLDRAGAMAADAGNWLWGTLQGDFNDNPTTAQIVVGSVISMIPVVDQLMDCRDVCANAMLLTDDDNANDTDGWIALTLTGIGFVPVVGSAVKGIGKVVIKNADTAISQALKILRKMGKGDPLKFIEGIDWSGLAKQGAKEIKDKIDTIKQALDAILDSSLARWSLDDDTLANFRGIQQRFASLGPKIDQGMADAAKSLKAKVDDALAKYKGEPRKTGQTDRQNLVKAPEDIAPDGNDLAKPKASGPQRKADDNAPVSDKTGTNDNGKPAPCTEKTCTNGEPISMVTGEELLEQTDFTLSGPIPLEWKRTYRSSNDNNRGLGYGWTHPLAEILTRSGDDEIVLTTDEGRYISFALPEVGVTSENRAERISLTRTQKHEFVLSQKGAHDKIFRGTGQQLKLAVIVDGFNNRLDFHYPIAKDGRPAGLPERIQASWGKQLHFSYDQQGLITQIEQRDENADIELVRYRYDDQQDLVEVVDANGNSEKFAYNNHVITKRTLKTGFSFYFEWTEHTKAAKCLHQWGDNGIYDYRFEWDDANRISKSIDSNGGVSTFHYNDRGQIVREIDPEGGEKRFEYDDLGQLLTEVDGNGASTTYAYDDDGNTTAINQPNGSLYQLSYDRFGNATRITNSQGHSWNRVYNDAGQLQQVTDPEGNTTRYEYNALGLPTRITEPSGQAKELRWNAQQQLVAENQQDQSRRFEYDARGNIVAVNEPGQGSTQYQYDPNGNVTAVINPDGSQASFKYNQDDRLTAYTDTAGRTTEYLYDGLSQVVKKIDPAGNTFEYHYDKERNLIGLVNEKGETYSLAYDKNERLVQEVGFDGRTQQYQYDPAGHLIAHIEGAHIEGLHASAEQAQANKTTYSRDPLGRLLQKQTADGAVSNFAYDKEGRLTQASNDAQYLEFGYSPTGNLTQEIQGGEILAHSYDAMGNRVESRLPDGKLLAFRYDAQQRFAGAEINGRTITDIRRDQAGREVARRQGALSSSFDYDDMGRLTRHQVSNQQSKQTLLERKYSYNRAGNLALIEDLTKGNTRYHYDALDRLKTVEGYENEQFAFDPAGNLLSGQTSAIGNRLTMQGDRHFTYDDAGNLIRENRGKGGKLETRYQYNAQNQLVRVDKQGQTTEYAYDALGRRISKKDAFGETQFLWNGDVLLSEQRRNHKKLYVYEPNSFRPLAQIQDESIFHYHLDHLGTPQEMTSDRGQIVWSARYKAYGNLALKETEEVENNLRFQGQYFDEESGLHYNRHRYYDPNSARFISLDPIGLLGGVNNYEYAPNPTGWVDPLGLTCKQVIETSGVEEQAKILVDKIPGLTEEQASYILESAYKRNSSAVFGGSRVRGNHTPTSDLDVGYGSLSKAQAQKINKNATKKGPLQLEQTQIVPGNSTKSIETIESPEEFFQRSGTRSLDETGDKAGKPYYPSGSITANPDGSIVILPPGGES